MPEAGGTAPSDWLARAQIRDTSLLPPQEKSSLTISTIPQHLLDRLPVSCYVLLVSVSLPGA